MILVHKSLVRFIQLFCWDWNLQLNSDPINIQENNISNLIYLVSANGYHPHVKIIQHWFCPQTGLETKTESQGLSEERRGKEIQDHKIRPQLLLFVEWRPTFDVRMNENWCRCVLTAWEYFIVGVFGELFDILYRKFHIHMFDMRQFWS